MSTKCFDRFDQEEGEKILKHLFKNSRPGRSKASLGLVIMIIVMMMMMTMMMRIQIMKNLICSKPVG